MHDDDTQLIKLEEEPRLAIWAVYLALTLLLLFSAIDYCYTVGVDNGEGWYPTVQTRFLARCHGNLK